MSNEFTGETEHIDWPAEFERTPPEDREPYPNGFRVTRSVAFENVLDELATRQNRSLSSGTGRNRGDQS